MTGLIARIRSFWHGFRRPVQLEAAMDEEMRFHIEMEAERLAMHRPLAASLLLVLLLLLPLDVGGQEILSTDSVELGYWRLPSEVSDRLIVAVHGGPGITHDYLRPEFDRYAEWGELVYYDQRGCGASRGAESYGWQDHVADLHALILTLRGDRSVVLVGSSFGATIISLYVGLYAEEVEGFAISGLYSTGNATPDEVAGRLRECPEVNRATIEGFSGALWSPMEVDGVPSLRLEDSGPGGAEDETPRRLGSQHFEMTVPSHDPWFTHRRAYFDAVREFFSSLDQPDHCVGRSIRSRTACGAPSSSVVTPTM